MQAQPAVTPQPAGNNMMSSTAHTLVPPPYKQDVPHPPAQHNISTMSELVLEGKVCFLTCCAYMTVRPLHSAFLEGLRRCNRRSAKGSYPSVS